MLASWVSVAEAKDDVVEDMDTSEPNWAWFYLAECGRWHIFGVSLCHTSVPSVGASVSRPVVMNVDSADDENCVFIHRLTPSRPPL